MSKTYTLPGGGQYRPEYPDSPFIHIADLVDQTTGKTYREMNAELQHTIPVGALVEIKAGDFDDHRSDGVRLYVVYHTRDCDMTPLYWLGPYRDDTVPDRSGFKNREWIGGFSEESLTVIRLPDEDIA